MLALDHRGSFKKYVNPDNPESVSDNELIELKGLIISSLEDQFSGVLIDPEWGLPGYTHPRKPYLLCLEKTGYTDSAGERLTELEYSAAELKAMGASGAKILLYFNPFGSACDQQLATAKKALADSHQNGLPLFLEIVTYGENKHSRQELVVESIKKFLAADCVPDVFKLEYPGNKETCRVITDLVGKTPWILLTRGESFEVFENQLRDAVSAGAVGFLAGRALWQEIDQCHNFKERERFLETVVKARFAKISQIVLGE